MTEQERINFALQRQMEKLDAKIQIQIDEQKARMNVMDARIDAALAELKEQRQDIRDLNKKHDALNEKIDAKFDKLSAQIQTMSLTTILGVGAIVWAIVSALK